MVPNIRGMVMTVGITVETWFGTMPVVSTVATTEDLTEVAGIIKSGFLPDHACR